MTLLASDVAPEKPIAGLSSLDVFSKWLLAIALLVVTGMFTAYLMLALPANDDFVRVTQPRALGFIGYAEHLYLRWQGRWLSEVIETALLPRGDMTRTYPALLAGVALVNFLGIYAVCRRFTRLGSRWFSLVCAVGLAAVFWGEMPSTAQAVYWFVGTVENAMPMALAGMLLVGLISIRHNIAWMIAASISAILICGLHEAYGAMLCIALTTGTLAAFWMKSQNRFVWLFVLIAAVIGLGIVIGAPGNKVRMVKDGPKHARHLAEILKLTATQFWNSGRAWIFDPKLLAASFWIAFSPRLEASRPLWVGNIKPLRLLIPLAWLAMMAIGFFLPSFAFGNEMPPRTLSGNFIVFTSGWLLIVFIWTRRLDVRDESPGLRGAGSSAIARIALAMALIFTGNTFDALHDLATRNVLKWRSSVETRYNTLRHNPNVDLVVPPLSTTSKLLYPGEIGTDPVNDFRNVHMAGFFHAKSVRIQPQVAHATTAPAIEPAAVGE